jgi:peptide/nickel transport system substrate-binding protein
MNSRYYSGLVSIVVVLGMVLAACGTPVASPPPAEETPLMAPTPAETTAAAPTEGPAAPAVFRFGFGYEIASADPALLGSDAPTDSALRCTYDTLVKLHGDPPEVEPLLADRWEYNDDLTEWTFYLRDDAVFHDGSPVTADAVKYSWDRVMALKMGMYFLWSGIADQDSLEVVDDHTVRWTLSEPYAPFESTLFFLAIVNPAVVRQHEESGDFGDEGDYGQAWLLEHEAGSGPFTIGRWEPGVEYVFDAVPDYWHGWPNEKHMDQVVVKVIREVTSRYLALRSGDVDMILVPDFTPEFSELDQDPALTTFWQPSYGMWMLMMNTQKGYTADVNVRKAIAYAFDYEGFLPTIGGTVPTSPMPEGMFYYQAQDMPTFDLEKAQEYLSQSQWPEGGFQLDIVYLGTLKLEELAALVLKDGLEQLNITLNLVPKTWSEMTEMCSSVESTPDLWVGYNNASTPDPVFWVDMSYSSRAAGTWGACHWYANAEVDTLIDEGRQTGDPEERARIYADIQERVAADQPVVWFSQAGVPFAYNNRLQGVDTAIGPANGTVPFYDDLYFADR